MVQKIIMHMEDKMLSYIKLYYEFLRNNIIRNLQFKEDFFMTFGEGMLLFIINITFYSAVFSNIESIGGWNKSKVMVLVATYQIFIGIFYGLFIDNLPGFSHYVNKGDLDFMLIKPVSVQFYISTRYVSIGHLLSGLASIPLLITSINNLQCSVSISQTLSYIFLLVCGLLISYSMLLVLMSFSIWVIKVNGLYMLMMQIFSFANYPKTIFKGFFKFVFTFVIPVIVICNFPVELLLYGLKWNTLLVSAIITIALLIVSNFFFRFALKFYSSASS